MSTLNKATLIGFVNSDVYENNGHSIFYLSTSESYKDKNDQRQVRYQSHKIFAGEKFNSVLSFVKKGHKIYIEGKINYYKPDDAQYTVTTIMANNIILLNRPNDDNNSNAAKYADNSDNKKPNHTESLNDDLPF